MSTYEQKAKQFNFDIARGFTETNAFALMLDEKAIIKATKKGCSHAEVAANEDVNKIDISYRIEISRFLKKRYGSCWAALKIIYRRG